MDRSSARAALDTLLSTELTVADHDELAAASRAIARVQSMLDHAKVQITRRTRLLADEGDTSSTHVLLDEGRLTGKDARQNDERDRVCETLPEFEDALASGGCTAGHLDAIARHTKDLTDEERSDLTTVVDDLLANAEHQPVGLFDTTTKGIVDKIRELHRPTSDTDELDRQRRASRVKRWTDRDTGMKQTLLSLDPIRDAALWNVIDDHLRRLRQEPANRDRPFSELQIEAVMAACNSGERAHRVPEIVVHTDLESMSHGRHPDTLCESVDGDPIPVATMQRMCCEAVITAVVVNPDGTVDQICEEQRTASRKQRRMLAAMYATCAHPHCSVAFSQCRIHHVVWFTRGGKTVLANLLPLCETHHHLVHEGGWNLTIDDQRRVTWIRPDGEIWHTDTGPNRRPDRSEAGSPRRDPRCRPPTPTAPRTEPDRANASPVEQPSLC